MDNKLKCVECRYVRQDVSASEYTLKRCKGCEIDDYCTCSKKECKCGEGCEFKATDAVCPKQVLKWAAYECGNLNSEYYKSLLNVSPNGDMQIAVTWSGCGKGKAVGV